MLWRSRGWCGFEFAAPVDRIDVDAEGVLAEHIGRSRWAHHRGENRGPAAGAGQRSALIRRLGPLHLERARRGSDYARDLHRYRPLTDIGERCGRTGVFTKELRAPLGGKVISRKPVAAHPPWAA